MRKLHVGCGEIYLNGWINVDIRTDVKADIHDDIFRLEQVGNGSIDVLYSCHNLEHFGFNSVSPTAFTVLKLWITKLSPGGQLYLSVPNLRTMGLAIFLTRNRRKQKDFIKAIFGGCDYSTNRHYIGFSEEVLCEMLKNLGMQNIRRFKPFVNDTSKFRLHGYFCSLNISAMKPKDWSEDKISSEQMIF